MAPQKFIFKVNNEKANDEKASKFLCKLKRSVFQVIIP